MTGIPVEDFVAICDYPKKKFLDSSVIVEAYLKTAANKAAVYGFEGFKIFKSTNLILLAMFSENINTGFVIGYRKEINSKKNGRWRKVDGFVTVLSKLHPYKEAEKKFNSDEEWESISIEANSEQK